jgi:hypothetical protein
MEKITIENITKIVGKKLANGRSIYRAGIYNKPRTYKDDYYEFLIDGVDWSNESNYNLKQSIVLHRKPGNRYHPEEVHSKDRYEMYNMGLQALTSSYLTKEEIGNQDKLIQHIDLIMDKTKVFYKNKTV